MRNMVSGMCALLLAVSTTAVADGALTVKYQEAWAESGAARTCRVLNMESVGKRRCTIRVECDGIIDRWITPKRVSEFTKTRKKIRQLNNRNGEVKKTC